MNIGKMISKLRSDKGLNQRELAKLLGVSNGAVGMWETGKRQPDLDTIKKLSAFLGVTTDYLIGNSQCAIDYANYQMGTPEFALDFKMRIRDLLAEQKISEEEFAERAGLKLRGKRFIPIWQSNTINRGSD